MVNNDTLTAFFHAKNDNLDELKKYQKIDLGYCSVIGTFFVEACRNNNNEMLKYLIESFPKNNPEFRKLCNILNCGGFGPDIKYLIDFTIKRNNLIATKLLLENGAKPKECAYTEPTLYLAVKYNHHEMVRLLLEHKANPNYVNNKIEMTSLELAKKLHMDHLVELMESSIPQ